MKITTKFKIGDFVFPISKGGYEEFKPCKTCDGLGKIKINNTERTLTCPDCYGRGGTKNFINTKWFVSYESSSAIGRINVTIFEKNKPKEVTYMIHATGIVSGTLWKEKLLFLTENEAKEECDKMNFDVIKKEDTLCRTGA